MSVTAPLNTSALHAIEDSTPVTLIDVAPTENIVAPAQDTQGSIVAPAQDPQDSMPPQQIEENTSVTTHLDPSCAPSQAERQAGTLANAAIPGSSAVVGQDLLEIMPPPHSKASVPQPTDDEPKPAAHISPASQSRVEALIEQQNMIMQRQLQLAEESCKQQENIMCHYRTPKEFLKGLDPSVRTIFANWRKKFSGGVRLYVEQHRLSTRYQDSNGKGRLMKPFSQESMKRWEWPEFYRTVAMPISRKGALPPDDVPEVPAFADVRPNDALFAGEQANAYDVDSAFMELRQKHAWELQNFVIAHQKCCMEKIIQDLALPNQVRALEAELDMFMSKNARFYDSQAARLLKSQAKAFVELVDREEMAKAEMQLKEGVLPSTAITTMMRIICIVTVLLAAATMSHELLTRLFAILFALVCGIALLWEDMVVCSLQLLLGETVRRLRLLGGSLPRAPSTTTLEAVWSPGLATH